MTQEKLGRYRILGELGRGAMGTVYRAVDPLIEREVAIKTLHPSLPPEVMAEVRERFVREAKSAGRLNHPNIVTIFDIGKQGDVIYIAMELLEGKSLQQILREPTRLPFETVAELVAQIADALDHAQQLGIVHRDVKPANVVISPSGRAKLTDFGIASVPSSTMTQTGATLGSPRYMSPEQVLGLPVDPRSDIFSLGVVLYQMLTGRTPFERPHDPTIFPLMNRIAGEPHRPVISLDPSIPAAFEGISSKALAKKPEDRYQRAGDMANDLRSIRSFEPSGEGQRQADDEKNLVLSRGPRTAQAQYETIPVSTAARAVASSSAEKQQETQLLSDVEKFSRNFEQEERARMRAEEEARIRKREELRRWAESEARKFQEFEPQRAGSTEPGPDTIGESGSRTTSRRAALEALKKQAETRPATQEKAAKNAQADARLDQSLRAAFQYLAEVAREMNTVTPAAGRPYEFFYFGRLPAVMLSEAFADLRSRPIGGKDHADHMVFKFRIRPTEPAKARLLGPDISRFQNYLEALKIPFELSAEAKDDSGQVIRAEFLLTASLPCEITLHANYDASNIAVEMVNVRRAGRVKCTLDPTTLDTVVDDLARYVLGVDDDFEKMLNHR